MVEKFFKSNMIHFLGSDVHRQNTIYPRMTEILSKIRDLIGVAKLDELSQTNPELALRNKRIDISEPIPVDMTFKEKLIMKFKK